MKVLMSGCPGLTGFQIFPETDLRCFFYGHVVYTYALRSTEPLNKCEKVYYTLFILWG